MKYRKSSKYWMTLKYRILLGDAVQVAVRYKTKEKKLEILGHKFFREFMEYLIYNQFERKRTVISKNITHRFIRFSFKYSEERFYRKLEKIKENCFVEQVKSFGRLIR